MGKKEGMDDHNTVYLPADRRRIIVAMDKWERHGGEQGYEFKMKQLLVDLKSKPSIILGKDWDLTEKVCRIGAKIIEGIIRKNEVSEELIIMTCTCSHSNKESASNDEETI